MSSYFRLTEDLRILFPFRNLPSMILRFWNGEDIVITALKIHEESWDFSLEPRIMEISLRYKAQSSSFANLSLVLNIAKRHALSDLVAILGSIDIVLGEIDR